MNEADPHPVGDHRRRGFGHFGQPRNEPVVGAGVVVREVMANGVINEGAQCLVMAVRNVDLEAAEANETGSHATHHRPRFWCWIAVVQDVSYDRFSGGHQGQGAGGGHAEVMHRLAAEKFSDGGAQHGFAVGGSGIGRETGAFELQFEEAVLGLNFAQRDGSPVAQLAGPVTKLVAAVALSVGLHARHGFATPKHDPCLFGPFKAQHLGHLGRPQCEVRFGGGRGRDLRPALAGDLAWPATFGIIAGCLTQEMGVPRQGLQRRVAHSHRHSGVLFNIMGMLSLATWPTRHSSAPACSERRFPQGAPTIRSRRPG